MGQSQVCISDCMSGDQGKIVIVEYLILTCATSPGYICRPSPVLEGDKANMRVRQLLQTTIIAGYDNYCNDNYCRLYLCHTTESDLTAVEKKARTALLACYHLPMRGQSAMHCWREAIMSQVSGPGHSDLMPRAGEWATCTAAYE